MGKKLAEKNTAKSALQQLLLPVYSALVAFQESSCAVTLSPYPCERNTHPTPHPPRAALVLLLLCRRAAAAA